jgi:hypothetical protein
MQQPDEEDERHAIIIGGRRRYPVWHVRHMRPSTANWIGLLEEIQYATRSRPDAAGVGCQTELYSNVPCPGPPRYYVPVTTCCDGMSPSECVAAHEAAVASACDDPV